MATVRLVVNDAFCILPVMTKLDEFFKVWRNVIFERAYFNQRNQLKGKSSKLYVTALYNLIETCEHGKLCDEMLQCT